MHTLSLLAALVMTATLACARGLLASDDIVDARVCDCRPNFSGQRCNTYNGGPGSNPSENKGNNIPFGVRVARLQCAIEHCGGNGVDCKHVQMQSNKLSFVAAPVRGNFSNLNDLLKRGETPLVDTLDVNSASIASIMKNSFGVLDASKPAYASLFHGFVHLPRAGNYSVGIRGLLDEEVVTR